MNRIKISVNISEKYSQILYTNEYNSFGIFIFIFILMSFRMRSAGHTMGWMSKRLGHLDTQVLMFALLLLT